MRKMILSSLLVAVPLTASAQTFAPAPSDAETRAPRPARADGIATSLAVEVAQLSVAACRAAGYKVTALVTDSAGVPIAMISDDGAAAITQRIASGKARTVLKLGISSGEAQVKARADAVLMAQLIADPAAGSPRPGAYPIMSGGKTIGALAVSGAPSGALDEPCAKVGIALIAGRLAARPNGLDTSDLPDPDAITFVPPADLKFEGAPGETRAKLFGDPEKAGPYGVLYKWEPGHNSKPHSHTADRYGYVISGTWWMSSARMEDKSTLYPVRAGSFVTHKAGQVHWDGAIDTVALVLVTGVGPIKTTRIPQSAK